MTKEITYLAIPYEERTQAFAAAGKLGNGENALEFDKEAKSWFAKPGANLEKLAKWLPKNIPTIHNNVTNIEESFGAELVSAGFILEGNPVMDGKWHRARTEADKGSAKSGTYRGFLDGTPAGIYQDQRNHPEPIKWVYTGHQVIDAERLTNARAAAAQQRVQREAQQKATYAHHAKRVNQAVLLMNGASVRNSYLARKQVLAVDGVKEDKKGRLIIPLHDENGQVHSLQRISGSGFKSLKKGAQKSGHFFRLGDPTNDGDPILYAEGYATAASIYMATNKTVYMTVDAGNMPTVATKLKDQFPNSNHIFLADNDVKNDRNKGLEKASEAAALTKGIVITPELTKEELTAGNTDFNDLHVLHGLGAISKQLEGIEAMQQPAMTEKIDQEITTALQVEGILPTPEQESGSFFDPTEFQPMTDDEIAQAQDYYEAQAQDYYEANALLQANYADELDAEQSTPVDQPKAVSKEFTENQTEENYSSLGVTTAEAAQIRSSPTGQEKTEEPEIDGSNVVISTSPDQKLTTAVPDRVLDKYVEVDGKFYFERNPEALAFIDKGTKIQTKLSNSIVAESMIDIAESRGWAEISVRGDKDFRRMAWLEGASRGLSVVGYKPREEDLAALKKMTKNRQVNEIGSSREQEKGQGAAQGATQGAAEPVNPMAGKLVDHGAAPYKHEKNNTKSYFVTLENSDGQSRTTWGKDLERVMKEAGLQPGQQIELENLGKKDVTISIPIKDKVGQVIGYEKKDTYRNEFAVKAEALRDTSRPLSETAQQHPDLINEIAVIKMAEKFSEKLPENQRDAFVDRVREKTAQNVSTGVTAPEIKIKERQHSKEEQHNAEEPER